MASQFGVHCSRAEVFTTLTNSSAVTDKAGRFELKIPGPIPVLWFTVDRDGFAEATVETARRDPAGSEWAGSKNLRIAVHPIVAVSGTVLDENGKPPDQAVELAANWREKLDVTWEQSSYWMGRESKVGPDGAFNTTLPAGHVTVDLEPENSHFSSFGSSVPLNYRLEQPVDIPANGMTGLHLTASRIDTPKKP
jgi:hypothetical protein